MTINITIKPVQGLEMVPVSELISGDHFEWDGEIVMKTRNSEDSNTAVFGVDRDGDHRNIDKDQLVHPRPDITDMFVAVKIHKEPEVQFIKDFNGLVMLDWYLITDTAFNGDPNLGKLIDCDVEKYAKFERADGFGNITVVHNQLPHCAITAADVEIIAQRRATQ